MEDFNNNKNVAEKEEGELSSDDDDNQPKNIPESVHSVQTVKEYKKRQVNQSSAGCKGNTSDPIRIAPGEENRRECKYSPQRLKRHYSAPHYENQPLSKYRKQASPGQNEVDPDDVMNGYDSIGERRPDDLRCMIDRKASESETHHSFEKTSKLVKRRNTVSSDLRHRLSEHRSAVQKPSSSRRSHTGSRSRASSVEEFQLPRYEMLSDRRKPSIKPKSPYSGLRIQVEDPSWRKVARKAKGKQLKEESNRSKYVRTSSRYRASSVEKFQLPRYEMLSDRRKQSIKPEFKHPGLRIPVEDSSWKEIARRAKTKRWQEESHRSDYVSLHDDRVRDHKKDKLHKRNLFNDFRQTELHKRYPRTSFLESAESTGNRKTPKLSDGRIAHNTRNIYTWIRTTTPNSVSAGTSTMQLNEKPSKATDEIDSKDKLQLLEMYFKLAEEKLNKRGYRIDRTSSVQQQSLNQMDATVLGVNSRNSIHKGTEQINLRGSGFPHINKDTAVMFVHARSQQTSSTEADTNSFTHHR